MNTIQEMKDLIAKNHGKDLKTYTVKAHGRLEIIGNHTDHNNGLCLVGGCSLGTMGAFAQAESGEIVCNSIGYGEVCLNANDLTKRKEEEGKTISIIRGVLDGFVKNGLRVGGFYLYCYSDIFEGAGVSSSACFESLICEILSTLYNGGLVSPVMKSKISQYAEREYFGKPCGMLDQVGANYGSVCFIDFGGEDPVVEKLEWKLPLRVVLVNTGGSHANLTPYYASIGADMRHVAKTVFGKNVLREVNPATFAMNAGNPWEGVSEGQKMRAQHFFDENNRVVQAARAIVENDVNAFLQLIRLTQISSQFYLRNTMVPDEYEGSPQQAIDIANQYIGRGACRIMGGGFAGSILCFLFNEDIENFKLAMGKFYGDKNVVEVSIPDGGCFVE